MTKMEWRLGTLTLFEKRGDCVVLDDVYGHWNAIYIRISKSGMVRYVIQDKQVAVFDRRYETERLISEAQLSTAYNSRAINETEEVVFERHSQRKH